jgi:hypothetical protein
MMIQIVPAYTTQRKRSGNQASHRCTVYPEPVGPINFMATRRTDRRAGHQYKMICLWQKGADAPQAIAHQGYARRSPAARAPDAIRCVWTALTAGYSDEVAYVATQRIDSELSENQRWSLQSAA